jgi:hypothetical protein
VRPGIYNIVARVILFDKGIFEMSEGKYPQGNVPGREKSQCKA